MSSTPRGPELRIGARAARRGLALHGSIHDNLAAALRSARRHRGHPLYADTVRFWHELLGHARRVLANGPPPDAPELRQLVLELETELADRSA